MGVLSQAMLDRLFIVLFWLLPVIWLAGNLVVYFINTD
jgi:hypothetical protein